MVLSSQSKSLTILLLFLLFLPLQASFSEPNQNEQEALQQFLSLHEIEKELTRISIEQTKLEQELKELDKQVEEQQKNILKNKEQAGKIARAYYMGDRNDLLLLLFSANDFQEMLRTYDLLSYVFDQDQKHLKDYHQELSKLQALEQKKKEQLIDLQGLEAHLHAQKQLMRQIEEKLAGVMNTFTDREKIEALQKQLILNWEERGIPTFDLFLKNISSSMGGVSKEFEDHVSFSFNGAKLTITDQEFTDYLRNQNDLFKDLRIDFKGDQIQFFGTYQDVAFTMLGSYILESESKVSFSINEIKYNGFLLPQSTAKDLESRYNLGIYTSEINDKLKIKKITVEDGELQILFTIKI